MLRAINACFLLRPGGRFLNNAWLLTGAMLICSAAVAQTTSTHMLGTVVDPSGAVVQGASIQARRAGTGELQTAKTNEAEITSSLRSISA